MMMFDVSDPSFLIEKTTCWDEDGNASETSKEADYFKVNARSLQFFLLFQDLLSVSVVLLFVILNIALHGTNISHLGKRNIIFKSALVGDMLVPRRVHQLSRRKPKRAKKNTTHLDSLLYLQLRHLCPDSSAENLHPKMLGSKVLGKEDSTAICSLWRRLGKWTMTGIALRANSSCDEMEIMFWWWLPCPKLTVRTCKMDGWNTLKFPFGVFRPIFRGELAVSCREGWPRFQM